MGPKGEAKVAKKPKEDRKPPLKKDKKPAFPPKPVLSGEEKREKKSALRAISFPFPKLVEIGRIALIKRGPDEGKICCIVDVIDANRYLVDGAPVGVTRRPVSHSDIYLTKFVIRIPRGTGTKNLRRNWEAAKLTEIWEHSKLAKKLLDAKKREAMNDFDRFKLARAKQIRNRIVRQRFVPMLRKARREGTLKPKKRKHQKKRKIIGAPKA